ncbi:UNKNOWN [Stylonychia lemnae]|uniref:Uncharacterized protein n=1 Tax=Stylonychia lemnae TaxID=5949 RepID=A0A077ZUR0_STYLE|nr:UNKNOWN [Stylonychia lemnae]|eukprot:CDW73279.1 UNKNOWN [Stylonychia lemnae]
MIEPQLDQMSSQQNSQNSYAIHKEMQQMETVYKKLNHMNIMRFGKAVTRQSQLRNRIIYRGELQINISNLFINGGFEVQLYSAEIHSQEHIQQVLLEINNRDLQNMGKYQINIKNEDDSVLNKGQQQPIKLVPYSAIIKTDGYSQEIPTQDEQNLPASKTNLLIKASLKMLKILKFLELNNIFVAAMIQINKHQENQFESLLSFLLERSKDFLSKTYSKTKVQQVDPFILDYINISNVKTPLTKNFVISSRQSNSTQLDTSQGNINMPSTAKNMFRGKKLQNSLRMGEGINDYDYSNLFRTNGGNRSPLNLSLQTPTSFQSRFDDKLKLQLPQEYEQDSNINQSTKQAQRIFTQLNQSRRAQSQITQSRQTATADQAKQSPKQSNLTLSYYLSEKEFYEAIMCFNKSLKSLSKAHLIELKNARAMDKQILFLLGQVLKIKGDTVVPQQEISNIIMKEDLKRVLLKIDPYRINVFVAQDVMRLIDIQNQIELKSEEQEQMAVSYYLKKYLISACQMSIGRQLFKYNEGYYQKYQDAKTLYLLNHPKDKNIDSQQLMDLSPDFQVNDPPKVTVSYRSSVSPKHNTSQNQGSQVNQSQTGIQGFSLMKRRIESQLPNYEQAKKKYLKQGEFLKPKHLILTDFRVLRPSYKIPPSIPIFNLHETLPKNILRQHFDEVEIPDIDLYNFQDATLSKSQFTKAQINEELEKLPEKSDDVLDYIANTDPHHYPTQVLMQLAKQMRERRQNIYENNQKKHIISKRSTLKKSFQLQ